MMRTGLSEIENHVRNLIANKFTKAELAAVREGINGQAQIGF